MICNRIEITEHKRVKLVDTNYLKFGFMWSTLKICVVDELGVASTNHETYVFLNSYIMSCDDCGNEGLL